ncbi:MAG: Gx transporter family protein [Deferribacteraceae bacterium]|jgi:heptaprenyl diphosphate synthase|nr:Gx transporter family protein [Deferribacteraceae bacterium]
MIGILGAMSVVLGVLENLLPSPIPGVRIGLANLPIMVMLYRGGVLPAFMVTILKISLVPILSGNIIFRLSLGVPSGVVAFIGMALCIVAFRRYISPFTVGIVGATLHMLTQLWVISHLYIKGLFATAIVGWYLLVALAAGIAIGAVTIIILERLPPLE